MKNIIKNLLLICLVIISIVGFTACNMFPVNVTKDYNLIVATAGDLKFTKRDLIDAYYNYGYQYGQSGNEDLKTVLNQTAKSMVERGVLLDYIKTHKIIDLKNYKPQNDTDPNTKGENKYLEIRLHAFETMQEAVDKIEKEIREEWFEKSDKEDERVPLRVSKDVFAPTVKLDENNILVRVQDKHNHDDIDKLPAKFETYNKQFLTSSDKLNAEIWSRYIKSLQKTAQSEGRSTYRADVLKFEQEKLEEFYTENMYLELYKNEVLASAPIDTDAVVKYYKDKYYQQKDEYYYDVSKYNEAMKGQLQSGDLQYYHDERSPYVYVTHILLKFGDDASNKIANLKTQYNVESEEQDAKMLDKTHQDFNQDYYDKYKQILEEVTISYEENNEVKEKSLFAVRDEIMQAVNSVQKVEMDKRFAAFDSLVYKYNDDDGAMNADFYYSINRDTNVQDTMLARFANASRELAEKSTLGDIYSGGAFEGLVITDYESNDKYGAHIIIHGGLAENIPNVDELTYEMLLEKTVNPASEKTLFHFIYDKLKLDENVFNSNTSTIITTQMSDMKVKYYEKNYKNLY